MSEQAAQRAAGTARSASSNLADDLAWMLTEHVMLHCRGDELDRWLFACSVPDDTPAHQSAVGRRWRRALKASGLSGVKLHDLRHFYASRLIAAGP
jgi:integrase